MGPSRTGLPPHRPAPLQRSSASALWHWRPMVPGHGAVPCPVDASSSSLLVVTVSPDIAQRSQGSKQPLGENHGPTGFSREHSLMNHFHRSLGLGLLRGSPTTGRRQLRVAGQRRPLLHPIGHRFRLSAEGRGEGSWSHQPSLQKTLPLLRWRMILGRGAPSSAPRSPLEPSLTQTPEI